MRFPMAFLDADLAWLVSIARKPILFLCCSYVFREMFRQSGIKTVSLDLWKVEACLGLLHLLCPIHGPHRLWRGSMGSVILLQHLGLLEKLWSLFFRNCKYTETVVQFWDLDTGPNILSFWTCMYNLNDLKKIFIWNHRFPAEVGCFDGYIWRFYQLLQGSSYAQLVFSHIRLSQPQHYWI